MEFILASNNRKKIEELRAILAHAGHTVISQAEAGLELAVEETGETFAENALLKAAAVVERTGRPAIADDSGLVVEALDGAPGVYSARYGGDACETDADRYRLLLKRMEGVGDRRAAFVSAIACVFPNRDILRAEGVWRGRILEAPEGEGGFGYDPVFYVPEEGLTAAELAAERKNQISHRARALRKFIKKLEKYYADK